MTADRRPAGWYAYGIVPAATPPPPGVQGVVSGTLQALASRVDLDEFSDERARDPSWLSTAVRAHEDVLLAALRAGPVLPLRFATLYSSRERIAQALTVHAAPLRAELRRLRGRAEWGVRLVADNASAEAAAAEADPRLPAMDAELEAASPGTAYLLRRKRGHVLREALGSARRRLAAELHDQLLPRSRDAVVVAGGDLDTAGEARTLIRAAYLVDDDRVDAFSASAGELRRRFGERGIDLQLTGPWPAHHFVRLDEGLAT